jgi:hypothetical protein
VDHQATALRAERSRQAVNPAARNPIAEAAVVMAAALPVQAEAATPRAVPIPPRRMTLLPRRTMQAAKTTMGNKMRNLRNVSFVKVDIFAFEARQVKISYKF